MHPVYLDTTMLLSFLATLEDGFSTSAEFTEAQKATMMSDASGQGEAGAGDLVSALGLTLRASGKYSRVNGGDSSAEQRFKREHTSASLFNRLYSRLSSASMVTYVTSKATLQSVQMGDIVEIPGVITENPAEEILRTMDRFLPFFDKFGGDEQQVENQPQQLNRAQRRNLTREQREALEQQAATLVDSQGGITQVRELVDLLRRDLHESPVVDLRLKGEISSGIVTASREFFSEASSAMLIDGTFRVIGKVTGINTDENAETNVMRRGAVAGMSPILDGFADLEEEMRGLMSFPPTDFVITGPCIQIIPLAIFV